MQISRRQLLVVASTATFVGFSGFSLQALAAELTLPSVGADKKFSAVPVPADPKRLAVLEYSVIENLQVLGLSDRIKAAVQTRNLPWLTALPADCKLVKSVKSVDIETVSSAKPDLIFISGRISRNIDAFKPIAPTVCLIPNKAEGWKSFRGNFLALAEVFGKKADAEKELKPLIVPGKGKALRVYPWNITLLRNTLVMHEGKQAEIKNDTLYIDGKPTQHCFFTKDYYWMASNNSVNLSDSRLFGFVPQDHIIGKASLIWFSKEKGTGIFDGYRWNRFFQSVK